MSTGINRREFLQATAGIGAAAVLGGVGTGLAQLAGPSVLRTSSSLKQRKLIVVLFGGGTRSSESISDPTHRYIPHLWNDLVPGGTLFTNMRVEHKVVHPNAAGSIMTGHWEWDERADRQTSTTKEKSSSATRVTTRMTRYSRIVLPRLLTNSPRSGHQLDQQRGEACAAGARF